MTSRAPSRALALLSRLANAPLPALVVGDADIELVRVLQLGGSLKASVPEPVRTIRGHEQAAATVLEVTGLGRQLLVAFTGRRTAWPWRRRASASRLAC